MVNHQNSMANYQITPFFDGESYDLEQVAKLTKRELQCLLMAANDNSTKEIARKLFISACTVRAHKSSILTKLKCKSLIGAYRKLIYDGC